jgi:DNA-binding protein HU-beta
VEVNKTQLIDALAERLGDKKIAAAAIAELVDVVVRTVNGGDKVTITGFGVFEKRARAARVARNPRTGQSVKVKKTNVPAFRPGTLFREVVSGVRKLPRVDASTNGGATAQSTEVQVTAARATKVATKAAKKESKTTAKGTKTAPTQATGKKAVKKSATKK